MNENKRKLFCIPYGGASALVYSQLEKYLEPGIELYPVELPGRGLRFKDSFYKDFWEAIDEIAGTIISETKSCEYAVLGHCMGSLIEYEVCKKIDRLKHRPPEHLFFSGSRAPHVQKSGKWISEMSEQEVLEELLEIGRIDLETYEDKQRLDRFLPVWINDCDMMDHYKFSEPVHKFNSNITVFGGKEDELVTYSDLEEWKQYAAGEFTIHELEGDHFFINEHCEAVVKIINSSLGLQ